MIAVRPGKDNTRKPIAMGSHLDTQPTGGKFDGVLRRARPASRCCSALHDAGYETNAADRSSPCWTNEEGCRFAPAMVGLGRLSPAPSRSDRRRSLSRIKRRRHPGRGPRRHRLPTAPRSRSAASSFRSLSSKLHIEQGPILEEESKTIGIVTGIQAIKWFNCTITGRESHAGTTPMNYRRDSLAAFAEAATEIRQIAIDNGGLATIGIVSAFPGSPNIIPGEMRFTLDMRHHRDDALAAMVTKAKIAIAEAATRHDASYEVSPLQDSPAQPFDATCIAMVRQATEKLGLPAREITSGAGHDAMYTARVCPTTMVFVPCAGGLSHNEAESATQDDCGHGAQVLLEAVLAYDARA